jgi:amino acid transporter
MSRRDREPPAGGGTDQSPTATPAEAVAPLGEQELEALRRLGRRWNASGAGQRDRLRALPVDPTLRSVEDDRRQFATDGRGELEATVAATRPVSRLGRVLEPVKRIAIGPRLRTSAIEQERMRKLIALPVLASGLFASVAYGPEAMLAILVLAGTSGLGLSLPLAGVLVVLMLVVGASYRETIAEYPSGAGSYVVAADNLGQAAGVTAAVALLADYVLNVAVSIATGIAAITSAVPSLTPHTVLLGLGMIALLFVGNMRGVREAGRLFAAPTYVFLLAIGLLICVGLAHAASRGFAATPPAPIAPAEGLTVLLVLRAFAAGATSITGIEATANAVPALEAPAGENARVTMTWMIAILVAIFVGLMVLIHLDGIAWKPDETLLSQLAHRSLGSGALYGFIQAATALMLLFAANTSYNVFPRLLSLMAREGHAPRRFLHMGERLAFSDGMVVLTVVAGAIFAGFGGDLQALIPLFAVGVFLAFTLSQAGMIVHSWRNRAPHWRRNVAMNAFGALLTAVVVAVAALTRFADGAWVVVVGIPLLVWLCLRVHAHYRAVDELLSPISPADAASRTERVAASHDGRLPASASGGRREAPEQVRHLILVPLERLDRANLRALSYAASLEQPLLAVHVSPSTEESERFRHEWDALAVALRLEIVVSAHRALVAPLVRYIELLHAQRPGLTTTVILTELVVERRRHRLLHSSVAPKLRRTLRGRPGIVITAIPFRVGD